MSQMNRVISHHSGGRYTPNATDIRAYHGLVDGDGQRVEGKFSVLSNAPGRIRKGNYAAHTWKLNSGTIGRAIASMHKGTWGDPFGGPCPVKPEQVDGLVLWIADDCVEWGIPVEREFVLTHAEVEITLGIKQRQKWDFDYDIFGGTSGRDPIAIGDELRQEVRLKLDGRQVTSPASKRPTLRQGAEGRDVLDLQRSLGLTQDGQFGPKTFAAITTFQRKHMLRSDGIVGRMTWAALLLDDT